MSRVQHLAYVTNVRVSSLPSARRLPLPEHSGTVLWCDMSVCWKGDEVHALRHYIKWWQSASAVPAAGVDGVTAESAYSAGGGISFPVGRTGLSAEWLACRGLTCQSGC